MNLNIYIPKFFKVWEFVPKDVFYKYGEQSITFIDPRIIISADQLREVFGPATINNYNSGGTDQYRGLRTSKCPEYSEFSQHSFGRALDITFSGAKSEECRKYIKANMEKFPYITRIEDGVSWLHIDCAWTGKNGVVFFKP